MGFFGFFLCSHTVIYIQTFDTRSYSNMKTAISKKSVYLNVSFEKYMYYTHQKHRIEIRVEECLFKRNDRFCMTFFLLIFFMGYLRRDYVDSINFQFVIQLEYLAIKRRNLAKCTFLTAKRYLKTNYATNNWQKHILFHDGLSDTSLYLYI